jgi:small subunit ribosomal protein S27Ae/ubiquitin C
MNDEIRPIDNVSIFQFLSADGTAHQLKPDDNSNEFTVVWLDEKIDTSIDCRATQHQLRHIFNYVEVFTDESRCLDYIKHDNIQNQKIFFIVSGLLAMKMVSRVIELPQILYIYIFCQLSSDLIPNGDKVRGTFIDKHTLFATLTQDVRQITKSLTEMSVFCTPTAHEQSIISTENEDFNSFQNFLKAIININYSDTLSKDEMIKQCRCYYRGNKYKQEKINEFEAMYTSKDAISWYTTDSFIYRLLNKALRTRNVEIVYAFPYFIVDLCQQIHELHWQQIQGTHTKISTLYRGQLLSAAELENLKNHIGKKISMNSFLSTSRSYEIASLYSGEGKQQPFLKSVVFQINLIIDEPNLIMPFCSIEHISRFSEEKEYLFKVGTVFQLISIGEVRPGVWLIQLKLKSVFDHSVHKTAATSKQVLLDFFKPSLTSNSETENIDPLIDEIPSRYCDLMSGYIKVAEAYKMEQNHIEQLVCYKTALQIYEDISDSKQTLLRLGYYAITSRLEGRLLDCSTTTYGEILMESDENHGHQCPYRKYCNDYQKTMTHFKNVISPNYHSLTSLLVMKDVAFINKSYKKIETLEECLRELDLYINICTWYCGRSPKKQFHTNFATVTKSSTSPVTVFVSYRESENKVSKPVPYEICTTETVDAFIEKVCASAGWTYKWRLQLVHQSHILEKTMTLAECGIQNETYLVINQPDIQMPLDILHCIRDTNCSIGKDFIRVYIRMLNAEIMSISLSRDEGVLHLKYRIYDYSGIHVDQQRLIYNGKQIEDDRMLSDYHVQHDSTINLVHRIHCIYTRPPFLMMDEQSEKVRNEQTDTLRRTIQEVRENYNITSLETKRNILLRLKENLRSFWPSYNLLSSSYQYVSRFNEFLRDAIKDYDKQIKLLEETSVKSV